MLSDTALVEVPETVLRVEVIEESDEQVTVEITREIVSTIEITVPGPPGPPGASGAPGLPGPVGEPDVPSLTLLFENQLV